MSDVGAASNGNASKSHLAAVQASIDKVENFMPKCDDVRLSQLKEEAERLRKLRQDNRRLQKNEKRKRSRLLAKGSGWNSHDILECFRIKHERELKNRGLNRNDLKPLTRTRQSLRVRRFKRGQKSRYF